jgi:lipopolysaccharide export system permease protein
MINTLDRMLLASYVRNFVIVLSCLLGLYVVVDLFMNLNDFTKDKGGLRDVLAHVSGYYSVQLSLIFDRLGELVTLAAAVFTVAWMQRNNELLPLLSAGVPTRRVIRPVFLGALLTLSLTPLNSELYIPAVADQLTVPRDDPDRRKPTQVRGAYDPNTKEHVVGDAATRQKPGPDDPPDRPVLTVLGFEYTSGAERTGEPVHLTAAKAVYVPPDAPGKDRTGGWELYNARPEEPRQKLPENVTHVGLRRYFVETTELDFDAVTRRHSWHQYAPTDQLWEELNRGTRAKQSAVAVLFHMRLTRPLVGFILVTLGLAVILLDQNRHVFISAGLCLVMAAVFYGCVQGAKYLGDQDILPAPLAAWLPVMVFGPLAMALFDAIHT